MISDGAFLGALVQVLKERLMRIGWLLDSAFVAIASGVDAPHSSGGGTSIAGKRPRELKRKRGAEEHA